MLSKYLEKKVEVLPNENTLGLKCPMELEYYLIESENAELEGIRSGKVYGIGITKKVNDMPVEEKNIQNFSCCRENTKAVLGKLAENIVTPVGLKFVLDDMLGI